MAGIFISYRRDDSRGFAGRLADDLAERLGEEHVFRDVEIPAGSDFTNVLNQAIGECDILIVVIGRRWAAPPPEGYAARLHEPTDWVRIEIEAALEKRKHIVPVLVDGAFMPSAAELPSSIARLVTLQAASLNDHYWKPGIDTLIKRLVELCPPLARKQTAGADSSLATLLDQLRREAEAVKAIRREERRSGKRLWTRLTLAAGRRISKFLFAVISLVSIYAGLRLFGDESVLEMLDALDKRLEIGWQRLLNYLARFREHRL